MAKRVCNLTPSDVECDEIWGYIRKKEGHKTAKEVAENEDGLGDAYCFIASKGTPN